MLELTVLDSKMVVRMVVILSDTLAGTADGVMKKVHHDKHALTHYVSTIHLGLE